MSTTMVILRGVLYGGILLAIGILLILARHESVFSEEKVAPVLAPFRRGAVWLYKRSLRLRARRPMGHGRGILLSEQVRTDLSAMDASERVSRTMVAYVIDKLMLLLLCLAAAAGLGLVLLIQGQQAEYLEGISIARPDYGAGDVTVRVEGTSGETTTGYDVTISERQYTSAETDALFAQLEAALPTGILGENRDTDHVVGDLVLPRTWEGYPFRLTYTSSDYAILHDDGTVCNAELEDEAGVPVTIAIKAVYHDRVYRTAVPVTVRPVPRSGAEQFYEAVQRALADADAETIYGGVLRLPQEVAGIQIAWEEPRSDQSVALFVLILFAGVAGCIIKDLQLREEVQRRERQMTIDYPQVVSKITLYLGAGMNVRNIFYKLGEDEQRARESGREGRYVYEEIRLLCRELDSGVAEATAYRNFAARCRSRPYTKLISLLTQNLQKGNSALLSALEDEASAAFEERKNIARQMGEEAGTRMLLPMMLMLIITLVIIVVPAYLGFS